MKKQQIQNNMRKTIYTAKKLLAAAVLSLSLLSPQAVCAADAGQNAVLFSGKLPVSDFADAHTVYAALSVNEAVTQVRSELCRRTYEFSVTIPSSSYPDGDKASVDILAKALSETDKGNEGDYIRFALKSYRYGYEVNYSGKMTIYYRIVYYSSYEDEKAVEKAAAEVISSLSLDGRSDYYKIRSLYDYVTSCASYAEDISDERIFTAYGALINGKCVCQGYSLLLYRLLKDSGIDCRILSGTSNGERHTWNMVRLCGEYYLLDPTWDASLGGADGAFFMRGSVDFDVYSKEHRHIPVYEYEDIFPDYNSAEFMAAYPQSKKRFIFGDPNGNGIIDGNDASYILSCYAAMSGSDFVMDAKTAELSDLTGNRIVDGIDASCLLAYYAAVSAGKKLSLNKFMSQR